MFLNAQYLNLIYTVCYWKCCVVCDVQLELKMKKIKQNLRCFTNLLFIPHK